MSVELSALVGCGVTHRRLPRILAGASHLVSWPALGLMEVTDWVVELTAHIILTVEVTVDITALIALPGCYS